MNDEQLLRDRLHDEVASIDLPPDLAGRVEAGARRRRRTRLVVAVAAAAATVLASGGLVAALRTTEAAPPPAAPAVDGCADLPAPAWPTPAPPRTDAAAWGYRGDIALRPVVAARAAELARQPRTTDAVPLLGERIGAGRAVLGIARNTADGWRLSLETGRLDGTTWVGETDVHTSLPRPVPGAQVSAILRRHAPELEPDAYSDLRNLLIVLAAPGTARIDYVGCRDGQSFRVGTDGATLVRDVGFLRGPGRLTIGGWSGRPTSTEWIVRRRPVDPRPPAGFTTLTVGQGQFVVSDQLVDVPLPAPRRRYESTKVIASCFGLGRMEVLISPIRTVPLTCDGQPHELYAGPLDTATDKIWAVGRNDLATRRTSLAITVLVVRAVAPR